MPLTYPPFAGVEAIRKASNSNPSLRYPDRGPGVKVLQAGLIDLGYKMPKTVKKTGFPDGVYGWETVGVVIQFQKDAHLTWKDGIAGKNTIRILDKKLAAKKAKSSASPPLPKPKPAPPIKNKYTIGTTSPTIKPDPGAGAFNTKPVEATMWALEQAILNILPPRGVAAVTVIGYDAAMHMKHYLDAGGQDYRIRLENMIDSGATAKARFRDEVNQAKRFVETLPPGTHKITSTGAESAYNYKSETWNWFYAVGGYASWGKGEAKVIKGSGANSYELNFEYFFFDRYNWDKGKSVTIGPVTITDEFMGEFHRQGLAREFNMKASIRRQFKWKQGESIPESQYRRGGGR